MTLQSVTPGDIVHCDVRGEMFYGIVDSKGNRELTVSPLNKAFRDQIRIVRSNQVKTRFKRCKS